MLDNCENDRYIVLETAFSRCNSSEYGPNGPTREPPPSCRRNKGSLQACQALKSGLTLPTHIEVLTSFIMPFAKAAHGAFRLLVTEQRHDHPRKAKRRNRVPQARAGERRGLLRAL